MSELFRKFARKISEVLGRAEVFLGAVVLIVVWAVLGPSTTILTLGSSSSTPPPPS
jgi:low affinity Fe/Cu permease